MKREINEQKGLFEEDKNNYFYYLKLHCKNGVNKYSSFKEFLFITIGSISITTIIITLTFMLVLTFRIEKNDFIPVKALNKQEATELAEKVILENGYTDLSKWQVLTQYYIYGSYLRYNYNDDEIGNEGFSEILDYRFNAVERKSCRTEYYKNGQNEGWMIYFPGKSSPSCERYLIKVFIDLYGKPVRISVRKFYCTWGVPIYVPNKRCSGL